MKKMSSIKIHDIIFSVIKNTILTIAVILFVSFITLYTIGYGFSYKRMAGTSMSPTLSGHDLAVLLHRASSYDKNDIVMIHIDGYPSNCLFTKRIAAVEGDTIEYKLGVLYVNGERYDKCDKLCAALAISKPIKSDYFKASQYTYTLGKDEYFVVGDNYFHSMDSRMFGIITIDNIKYEVLKWIEMPWSTVFEKL